MKTYGNPVLMGRNWSQTVQNLLTLQAVGRVNVYFGVSKSWIENTSEPRSFAPNWRFFPRNWVWV